MIPNLFARLGISLLYLTSFPLILLDVTQAANLKVNQALLVGE